MSSDSESCTDQDQEKKRKRSKRDKDDRKEKKSKKEKKHDKEKKQHNELSKRDENGVSFWSDPAIDDEKDRRAIARAERSAAKQAEKVAKVLGYTNETNPFGDSNLLKPFVWGKKREKEQEFSSSGKDVNAAEIAAKRLETMTEIEAVRARRQTREQEQKEAMRVRLEEQRLREVAQFGDWEAQEEEFHLRQAKLGSQVRIAAGRATVIDLLAKNMLLVEAATEAIEAHNVAARKTSSTGRAVPVDVQGATADLLHSCGKIDLRDPISLLKAVPPMELASVLDGIQAYLTLAQRNKAKSAAPAYDISFGESNLPSADSLSVPRSDAEDYERFWQALKQVAQHLLRKSERLACAEGATGSTGVHTGVSESVHALLEGKDIPQLRTLQQEIDTGLAEGTRRDVAVWEAMSGEIGIQIATLEVREVHMRILEKQRNVLAAQRLLGTAAVSGNGTGDGGAVSVSDSAEVNAGDDADQLGDRLEGLDNAETDISRAMQRHYAWADKHRPRKPRYLNKVRTGWDWNKYNSTHYDHDNPPPRTVQGYQFTIFYPDMLDKTAVPTYHLEAAASPEFAVLRFHAPGGPYEDVAFQILNKEWDINRKAGFHVRFERGVLSLSFNFKRMFYRR